MRLFIGKILQRARENGLVLSSSARDQITSFITEATDPTIPYHIVPYTFNSLGSI